MAENNCVVCFKNFRIYSVGECDHPVCFECSTRMRVLCCQKECPMCRHEMGMVVFTEKVRPFRRLKRTYTLFDKKYNIAFENEYVQEEFECLLLYVCQKCHREPVFDTLVSLNEHMKRKHDLYCCQLCADNLKIFPGELRYYTKQELNRHNRIGDLDDRSHRGHPLCEFCQVRYLDKDELYRHLRKEHFFCHICEGEGVQQFYGTYILLRDHYKMKHYLCEEGECMQETMTSVFPTEIDLKAHKALVHFKNSRNKQALRQVRTLELEFSLPPRASERRARHHDVEDHPSNQIQSNFTQEPDVNLMATLEQDFPTLGNSSSYHAPRPKFTRETKNRYEDDFPALCSETNTNPSTSSSVASTSTSVPKKVKEKRNKNVQNNVQGSSTSTPLSLTWVEKAKEKKPSPEIMAASSTSQGLTNPPSMSRKNFPNLQKGLATQESSSSNKSKKNSQKSPGVENNSSTKAGYSEVAVKNVQAKEKTSNKSKVVVENKETKNEPQTLNSNKDNKTHTFLLNANRKKVKMKPETLITLNDLNNKSLKSLPESVAKSTTAGCSSEGHSSRTSNPSTSVVSDKGTNCDRKKNDKGDVRMQNGEMKEGAESKGIKSPRKNEPSKSNSERSKPAQSGESPKKDRNADAIKKKNQKSNKNVESETKAKEETPVASSSKPPPGFEKRSPAPAPPPGFNPLNCAQNEQPKLTLNNVPLLMNESLLMNKPFLYQEPDEFASRNSQLVEKIGDSLVRQSKDALDEFKNMSLLFREGLVPALDYYLYCVKNIKEDRFVDVFVDLVALLPNIVKQQELWTIYYSAMPSSVQSSSLVDYCEICFQILKLDDTVLHYSKHGLLQYSSLEKY